MKKLIGLLLIALPIEMCISLASGCVSLACGLVFLGFLSVGITGVVHFALTLISEPKESI